MSSSPTVMDSLRPIRPHPRHMMTIYEWYDAHEQEIEDMVCTIMDALATCKLDSRISIKISDPEALEDAIVEHLYRTSYNAEKRWP